MPETKETPPANEGRLTTTNHTGTNHTGGHHNADESRIPGPGINLQEHGALAGLDEEVAYARGLAEAGLELLLVNPNKSTDDHTMQRARRDHGLGKSARGGFYLASADPDLVATYVRYQRQGRDNLLLGVRVGQESGLVIVDADTAEEVATFSAWWSANVGGQVPPMTVASPGVAGSNHKDGGHWWFVLPEGYSLPETIPASVPVRGVTANAMVKVRDGYVLIPPTVRPDGPYRVTGAILTAPAALLELLATSAPAPRENGDYDRDTSDHPIDQWAASVTWDELLTEAGWTRYSVEACGCPTWTRPGGSADPKSAVAHDPATCLRDNDQLHIWSHTVQGACGTDDLTKAWFVAWTWHGGDLRETLDALGIERPTGGRLVSAEDLQGYAGLGPDMPAAMAERLESSVAVPIQARHTDAGLAQTAAEQVLRGRFLAITGLGWLQWDGTRWTECADSAPTEAWRRYVLAQIADAATNPPTDEEGNIDLTAVDVWKKAATTARLGAVLKLAAGIIETSAERLDADPDVLNTRSGTVDLRTGELRPHDPADYITKITRGAYRPGFTHPDVSAALQALPEAERGWMQRRIGQGITGHTTPDGVLPILQGSGENGKSLLTTDGLLPALGGYADVASPRLFSADRGSDHSTERADLRGKRLLIGEELSEGRSLDITALKRIQDVAYMKARYLYRDNITFKTSHSLFVTTNYVPVVSEVDHGTWRRLALVRFPYTFRKRAEDCAGAQDRVGDPGLKARIKAGRDGQHDALVTWAVEGARAWYAEQSTALLPTPVIASDTRAWRASSDRIVGFWDEYLVADGKAMVASTDLLAEFNKWLDANGHQHWTKELFGARFGGHALVSEHRVEKARPRHQNGLSRPAPGRLMALPELESRPRCWVGIRFRTPADDSREELASEPVSNPFVASGSQAAYQRE